ncbi:unnamed protein product [Owenia fusiformis]|uniref:Peptidase S8/S53 domain-containing protein n=1 Tax=Owenia fusiformis TaxID=6347 RepID=A0A8S4PW71_OWEFU|nr:unnamed protein product [Owenia fusiformis]
MDLRVCCFILMLLVNVHAAPRCLKSSRKYRSHPSGLNNRYIIYFEKGIVASSRKAQSHFDILLSYPNIRQRTPTATEIQLCNSGVTSISEEIVPMGGYILTCPSDNTLCMLVSDPEVREIVQDTPVYAVGKGKRKGKTTTTPPTCSSPFIEHYILSGNYWGLDRINQPNPIPLDNQFSVFGEGNGVDTYVIDTGIYSSHIEFAAGQIDTTAGYNFVDENNPPNDDHSHGTIVSGIVAGTNAGVCKKGTIIAFKVLRADGSGTSGDVIAAINKAIVMKGTRNRPSVINLSLGGPKFDKLDLAVKDAVDNGIFVSVAAGNDNRDASRASPAGEPSAFTVASVNSNDYLSSFSNYGRVVDCAGPGENIRSSSNKCNSCYGTYKGTSFAAPHVAGVAACFYSIYPTATVSQVENYLKSGAWTGKILGNLQKTPNRILRSNYC